MKLPGTLEHVASADVKQIRESKNLYRDTKNNSRLRVHLVNRESGKVHFALAYYDDAVGEAPA